MAVSRDTPAAPVMPIQTLAARIRRLQAQTASLFTSLLRYNGCASSLSRVLLG